jgi:hypothetical protein
MDDDDDNDFCWWWRKILMMNLEAGVLTVWADGALGSLVSLIWVIIEMDSTAWPGM